MKLIGLPKDVVELVEIWLKDRWGYYTQVKGRNSHTRYALPGLVQFELYLLNVNTRTQSKQISHIYLDLLYVLSFHEYMLYISTGLELLDENFLNIFSNFYLVLFMDCIYKETKTCKYIKEVTAIAFWWFFSFLILSWAK